MLSDKFKLDVMETKPYVAATRTAVIFFFTYTLLRYLIQKEFSLWVSLIGTAVFWVAYYLLYLYLGRNIKKLGNVQNKMKKTTITRMQKAYDKKAASPFEMPTKAPKRKKVTRKKATKKRSKRK